MLELLTAKEMSVADRLTAERGVPGYDLMQNAGDAVADEVFKRYPQAESVSVLCGPGNNGGDGFVAAVALQQKGYRVRLGLLGSLEKLPGDAAAHAERWEGEVEPLSADLLDEADVVIDAIFGAGLARPIEGDIAALIEALNDSDIPAIAVDVPSGIDGTSGSVRGIAIEAEATVTFFRLKPGHLLLPGRLYCGEITLADIGIPDSVLQDIAPSAFGNEPRLWLGDFPWPEVGGHKYSRGHAVVVSGPADATGAARLAARGALRIGAGLVTMASPKDALSINASQLTAVMVRPVDGAKEFSELLSDTRKNSAVLGPGLGVGKPACEMVQAALESRAAVVIDADGLTSFADAPDKLFDSVQDRQAPTVFTPHAGEFARLFPDLKPKTEGEPASKLESAREAAKRSGAVVVFKGPDTVVATPDGRASINATSSPWLATAGTGDVLAGMIGGLLAQEMLDQALPVFEAVSAAVWLHGEAARAFGPGLISEDVPEMLPEVFRALLTL
ncbi:Bifunctional NAD(P)H-hydrate repair enzyme Nnr [Methyloligella halotolerans]|uniref:Bifunctional NAD(P)H-hydrate repair enzyme n=1 Tax=Methyloligella halotolerans TaxID=1177755 RepID=A0A1E2S2Q6_9HYPH|nr:NAD(P)H-hydrate dehydratase [Methyloligella halotolerans]ODA68806.1 Bifunctional NAD(P)H-hydrate repair enzyme Nnr [Methyloligella halotolerans]